MNNKAMITCSKCGKRMGLLEYVSAKASQRGLCRDCRLEKKLCSNCIHFLELPELSGKSSVARCLKYGYDLSDPKSHLTANNCPFYSTNAHRKKAVKEVKGRNASRKKVFENVQVSETSEDFWEHYEEWRKSAGQNKGK